MTATIIDGNVIANRMREEIAQDAQRFKEQYGYSPGLGVVLAGDNPASQQYVRMKQNACKKAGIESVSHIMTKDSTQAEVEAAVAQLNQDPKIHGILVQLPLPQQVDEESILRQVSLDKDVDGFHPINIGMLGMKGRDPLFTPATPTGCMVLLNEIGATIEGANAVVVGRSNIVGLPMALMLIKANATVTVVHSRTKNMPDILKQADIVIAAIGKPNFIKGHWLKPGSVVIDVGTNRVDDPESEKGYKWVGDVDLESAQNVVSAITKVPGGVGPMTITMLMHNTMKAAWRIEQAKQR
ncbi:MAG: bifunctional 5,10-methylenetetrahydrofolate dehydrogenase/5,10-methenyltetrahydrofolate cyclohydrolase [Chloroflexi bacterium]|nr:MAG: bifunctional 5,10-methylenetetrahydrofolate dehydrogenase/5,10-methenyltetrahydrofolate cyclohydrolase [Chloroflexota bacterium]